MKKLILFFVFVVFYVTGYSQVIKGTIFDSKTDSTICFASVYFNGTFVGTLSDANGNFELDISKNTSMPLTVSSIGYNTVTLANFPTNEPLLIYMTPEVYNIDEVVISSKSLVNRRKANIVLFRNEFLGTTVNARNCEILNESDIIFSYENDTLKAFAKKPISIVNKALGYKITYYLDRFEYCKKDNAFVFSGNIIYTEDLVKEGARKQVFEKRRENTYLGSRMHFFRSLYANDIAQSGFTIENMKNEKIDSNSIVEVDSISSANNPMKCLKCNENVYILFGNRISGLALLKEKVYFKEDGYFDQTGKSICWTGNMAMQRIGDLLPYEYKYNRIKH